MSKNAINHVFNTDCDVSKLFVPTHKQMKFSSPSFKKNEDYSKLCNKLQGTIEASLEAIKNHSLENNWLQESVDYHDDVKAEGSLCSPVNGIDSSIGFANKSRRRRLPCELDRDHKCPFLDCMKEYSSKNALKLHIKRNHNVSEPLKSLDMDAFECIPKISPYKRGIDLSLVFKGPHIQKMESRVTMDKDSMSFHNRFRGSGSIGQDNILTNKFMNINCSKNFSNT